MLFAHSGLRVISRAFERFRRTKDRKVRRKVCEGKRDMRDRKKFGKLTNDVKK